MGKWRPNAEIASRRLPAAANGNCGLPPVRRPKGWDALCQQAAANTATAWGELRRRPQHLPPTSRHHRLKGRLASAAHREVDMEQWRYEVTGAGRIWYLVDTENSSLWLRHAGPRHPKDTE